MTSNGRGAYPRGLRPVPPPPCWAERSVAEDGGVTHERVSPAHPALLGDRTAASPRSFPTDVSVSVFDQPRERRWTRSVPTIQVEGGSYSLEEARRLVAAVQELIAAAAGEPATGEPAPGDPPAGGRSPGT